MISKSFDDPQPGVGNVIDALGTRSTMTYTFMSFLTLSNKQGINVARVRIVDPQEDQFKVTTGFSKNETRQIETTVPGSTRTYEVIESGTTKQILLPVAINDQLLANNTEQKLKKIADRVKKINRKKEKN